MPTYEYKCNKCGHEVDAFQSMSDAPLKRCPKCHKNGLERLISAGAGIIFKGSGFYATDYKRTPASTSSHGPSTAGSGSTNGESKSDTTKSGDSQSG